MILQRLICSWAHHNKIQTCRDLYYLSAVKKVNQKTKGQVQVPTAQEEVEVDAGEEGQGEGNEQPEPNEKVGEQASSIAPATKNRVKGQGLFSEKKFSQSQQTWKEKRP
jgi:hypothetical protein